MSANTKRRQRRWAWFNAGNIKKTERERMHSEAILERMYQDYWTL